MKIMFLGSSQVSIPPERGGAIEAIIYEQAKYLEKDNEVYVVTRKASAEKGINFLVVKSKVRKNKLFALGEDLIYGLRCIGKIRKVKPDVIHLNTTFVSLPIAFFKFLLPKTTKIVYTSHSPAWTVPDEEIGRANRIFNRLEAFVMKRTTVTTAVAESMRRGMIKRNALPANRVITIENFTRNDIFSGKYGKSWKKHKGIKGLLVLFVGKLTETKGVPYLLRAVKEVGKVLPSVKFVLVGSLEHEQKLQENPWAKLVKEEEVEDKVLFTGSVSSEELPKIYAAADVFVLPSLREGMPLVVMEALATGLPIVATKVSGTAEVLNDKCAVLIERQNSGAIAKALIKILTNKKLSAQLHREALRTADRFSKERILEKYKNLYYSLKR